MTKKYPIDNMKIRYIEEDCFLMSKLEFDCEMNACCTTDKEEHEFITKVVNAYETVENFTDELLEYTCKADKDLAIERAEHFTFVYLQDYLEYEQTISLAEKIRNNKQAIIDEISEEVENERS